MRTFFCNYVRQRWFYLDVFACSFLDTSKNVPEAPARARQCRPTGRRAQGIFGAEWPSTRPNGVVAAQRVKFVLCRCRQAVAWGQGCGVFAKPALYRTRRQRFNESGVRELSVIPAAYE